MSGRARGRARAREPAAAQEQAPRRPAAAGAPAPVSAPAPQPAAGGEPSAGANGNGNGAGRASHRGGARGEPRPGPVDSVSTQMDRLTMGTQGEGRTRSRMTDYNEVHTRPAHITDKRGDDKSAKVNLVANYYKVVSRPDWHMYQYRVDFSPTLENIKLCKGLIYAQKEMFGTCVFDGTLLFTTRKLPNNPTEFVTTTLRGEQYRVTVKMTAELPPNDPTCLHQFNVLIRQCFKDLDMKEIQRAHFDPQASISIPRHKLEIWPGFKTSILQYEDDILMNLDVSHKVLRTDSALDLMYQLYNNMRGNTVAFTDACNKQIVGQIVLTRYNNKSYRIDDFEWDIHPTDKFKRRVRERVGDKFEFVEREMTYVDYYKEQYQITVKDMQQPMLVSKPKRKEQLEEGAPPNLYLLPELCTMTGLTDDMKSNFGLMKDMGEHTRVSPANRAAAMMKFMGRINANETSSARLTGWDIKFDKNLVNLQGRRMAPETIILGKARGSQQNITVDGGKDADWGRSCRGNLYTTVNMKNWLLVYVESQEMAVNGFCSCLQRVAPPLGIQIGAPIKAKLQSQRNDDFLAAIKSTISPDLQMVVVILPSNKKDLYDAIKKQCCIATPIPSQCVTIANVKKEKNLMSVVTKIAIQLNCKLGGEPWALQIPMPNAMVIGFDTYHNSVKAGHSVGGFVASLNQTFTRYFSQTVFQSPNEELVHGLKVMFHASLKKYHAVNGRLPAHIIVYRDGVGDGQLNAVRSSELPQFLQVTKDIGQDYNPEMVFIVVKKRINTRFLMPGDRKPGTEGLENPPPGTIVDSVVTRKEWYDFFLVAQSCKQGTVTPTHFNVIWDTSTKLNPARIQRLTYKLCHLYYNWPATVRVPAPCQYAHKLAFLTGQNTHKQADLSLCDKLYFL